MDDDESLFDAESGHGDTQDDISMKSEEDNSDSMNVGEDQNPTEDEINIAEMLKTFKHVQEACSGTQPEMDFFFQFCPAPKGGWTFIDKILWRSNPFGPSGNVSIEQTVETERKDNAKTVEAERNDNAKTDVLHMESLPFTEIPKESIEPVPLVAISTTGEHIDTATTPLPFHPGGSFVSAKSIGGNGLSDTHASFSNQVPWCSSSAKLAVHRPRRMVIPSKYKLSPYMMPQSKITVSRLEADVYEVVLKMAESEHRNVTVIDYGQVVVKISALASSLKPQG